MVDYIAMGRRMKMKRRSLKISQEELAQQIKISVSFYVYIERGRRTPSIDTLVAIANALNVGTDFLLADSVNAAEVKLSSAEMRVLKRYLQDRVAELDFDADGEANGFF